MIDWEGVSRELGWEYNCGFSFHGFILPSGIVVGLSQFGDHPKELYGDSISIEVRDNYLVLFRRYETAIGFRYGGWWLPNQKEVVRRLCFGCDSIAIESPGVSESNIGLEELLSEK